MKYFLGVILAICAVFGAQIKPSQIKPNLLVGDSQVFVISLFDRAVSKELLTPTDEDEQRQINLLYSSDRANTTTGNVILVKNPKFNLLINVGDKGLLDRLKFELKLRGLKPKDITHVALSNGYVYSMGGLGEVGKSFMNATLLIDKNEYEYWLEEGDAMTKKRLHFYKNKISFLANETEIIKDSLIKSIIIPGRTPGMSIFSFNDEYYYIGDLIYSFDIELNFTKVTDVFDMDEEKSSKIKEKLLNFFKEKNKKFVGYYAPESDFLSYDEWLELVPYY